MKTKKDLEDTFQLVMKDNFQDGTTYKYIRADLVDKLIEALKEYADSDNWTEPNGGGSCDIFMERFNKPVSFNGYDIAEEALNEWGEISKHIAEVNSQIAEYSLIQLITHGYDRDKITMCYFHEENTPLAMIQPLNFNFKQKSF